MSQTFTAAHNYTRKCKETFKTNEMHRSLPYLSLQCPKSGYLPSKVSKYSLTSIAFTADKSGDHFFFSFEFFDFLSKLFSFDKSISVFGIFPSDPVVQTKD